MKIKDAAGKVEELETTLKVSLERLASVCQAATENGEKLLKAEANLVELRKAVEDAVRGIAEGSCNPTDVKTARGKVHEAENEVGDLRAIGESCLSVEQHFREEVAELQRQVMMQRKLFWSMVSSEFSEKAKKAVGDSLRKTLAAQQLGGRLLFADELGSRLVQIFFQGSHPDLTEDKARLIEEFLPQR